MIVPSDVLPLVYALLISAGLKKTASVLSKEAKLQPKAFKNKHDLLDVYEFYQMHNTKKASVDSELSGTKHTQKKQNKMSSSGRKSSFDLQAKKKKKKKNKVTAKKVTSSSSEDEEKTRKTTMKTVGAKMNELPSSDSDDTSEVEKKKSKIAGVKKKESDDSSDSNDSLDEEKTKSKKKKTSGVSKKRVKATGAALSDSDDSSNSSDSSDKAKLKSKKRKATKTPAIAKNNKKAKRETESSSDDSSSSDDDSSDSSDSDSDTLEREKAQKKEALRREQASKAALEWQPKKIEKVVTKTKSTGTPFQRVDGEFWSQKILDDTLRDNSYEGTFGIDGVGVKANNKLVKTRGKDFTKGKNKLKRSTYMCGAISMASNSFKFED